MWSRSPLIFNLTGVNIDPTMLEMRQGPELGPLNRPPDVVSGAQLKSPSMRCSMTVNIVAPAATGTSAMQCHETLVSSAHL